MLGIEQNAVPYTMDFQAEQGEGPEENGRLAIRAYGTVLGEISLEDIRQLPPVERRITIHSTAGVTDHRFTGTLLSNVLAAVDPGLMEEYDLLMTVGVDDYCSGIEMRTLFTWSTTIRASRCLARTVRRAACVSLFWMISMASVSPIICWKSILKRTRRNYE